MGSTDVDKLLRKEDGKKMRDGDEDELEPLTRRAVYETCSDAIIASSALTATQSNADLLAALLRMRCSSSILLYVHRDLKDC